MVKTIFMIDDDAEDQEFFSETVSAIDQSITCINFSDCRKALKILMEGAITPDFIFLDINLPKMNGYEFLEEIKNYNELKDIPVIMYSTSSAQAHIEKASKLGASSFITKPYSLGELKEKLESVFS